MESTLSWTLRVQCILTSTKTGLWSCDSCIMNADKNYFNSTCSVNWAVQKPLQNVMMLPFLILFSSQLCIHPGMSWFLHLLSPSIYKNVVRIGQPYLLQRTVYWDEDNRHLMKLQWWQQQERQKRTKFNKQNNNSAPASCFFVHSLLSLHNYNVKWPNFEWTWEREGQGNKFYFLSLNSDAVPSLQFQPNFPPFKWLRNLV